MQTRRGGRRAQIRKKVNNKPKSYNKLRGIQGRLYGTRRSNGKAIIDIGGTGYLVDPGSLELLDNSKTKGRTPCKHCGKVVQETSANSMMQGREPPEVNMSRYVNVGEARASTQPLFTGALATCVALGMKVGKRHFLAHLSATTDVRPIIEALRGQPITKVKLWTGTGDDADSALDLDDPSFEALALAAEILAALKVPLKMVEIEPVCYLEVVGLD
jgi:hypothetical protein